MASVFVSSSWFLQRTTSPPLHFRSKIQSWNPNHGQSFKLSVREVQRPKFSAQDQEEQIMAPSSPSTSSVAMVSEEEVDDKPAESTAEGNSEEDGDKDEKMKQQEMDWKADEEFKSFMGNPSIEAAIKLEKKRADRKLRELDQESAGNPIAAFFRRAARESLEREKERLEQAEEAFKALDLNKVILNSSKGASFTCLLSLDS